MKLFLVVLRSVNNGVRYHQCNRSLSTLPGSTDAFSDSEKHMFGESQGQTNSLYHTYDKVQKGRYGPGLTFTRDGDASGNFEGDDNDLTTLTDGMEGKLKQAATYFEVDPQEIASDDYTYRQDVNLKPRMTYTPEDLNIRKPGVWRPTKRAEFEVTTKEVLENADFRNVRFLANFLTEAGLIIKRSKTGISAKAQRKVAREINIARNFGLMPFTTQGTKAFEVGKTMQDLDQDFEVDPYENPSFVEDVPDSIAE